MFTDLLAGIFELLNPAARHKLPADSEPAAAPEPRVPWVLHVEDDPDFSQAVKGRLERHGVAVVRAFDGMEGFRTAFLQPADAILLDLEMPNGNGQYVLNRLKSNPATKDIPVIVLSGVRDRSVYRQIMNLGAARFLNKPVDFDALLGELSRHIPIVPELAA